MARHAIIIDKRTVEGRNVYDFLKGMKYVDETEPGVANIDERTSFGRSVLDFLYSVGVINSPYSSDYVARIRQAEEEIKMGQGVEITDIDAL